MSQKWFRCIAFFALSTIAAQANAQCPSCDPPPALDCPLKLDSNHVSLSISKQFACRADTVASYGESRTNTCRRTFGPPFLLVNHSITNHSSNNGSQSVSRYASGAKIEYQEKITEAYDQAIELAGKYNDKAAEGQLKEMKKRHLDLLIQYSTNQDTIELKVEASGHGWALDRKRGWQDSSVNAEVACILPVNLLEQIRAHVALKGEDIVIRNGGPLPFYMHYAIAEDQSMSCAVAKPALTMRFNRQQGDSFRIPISNGKIGKLCVHYYDANPDTPNLSQACEYQPGQPINIASLPGQCSN